MRINEMAGRGASRVQWWSFPGFALLVLCVAGWPLVHSYRRPWTSVTAASTILRMSRYSHQLEKIRQMMQEDRQLLSTEPQLADVQDAILRDDLKAHDEPPFEHLELRRKLLFNEHVNMTNSEKQRQLQVLRRKFPQLDLPFNYTAADGNIVGVPFVREPMWYMVYSTKGRESLVCERLRAINSTQSHPLHGLIHDTFYMRLPRFVFERRIHRTPDGQPTAMSFPVTVVPHAAVPGVLFIRCAQMSPDTRDALQSVEDIQRMHKEKRSAVVEPLTDEREHSLTAAISEQQQMQTVLPENLLDIERGEYVNVLAGSQKGSYGIVKGIKDNRFQVTIRSNGMDIETIFVNPEDISALHDPPETHYKSLRDDSDVSPETNVDNGSLEDFDWDTVIETLENEQESEEWQEAEEDVVNLGETDARQSSLPPAVTAELHALERVAVVRETPLGRKIYFTISAKRTILQNLLVSLRFNALSRIKRLSEHQERVQTVSSHEQVPSCQVQRPQYLYADRPLPQLRPAKRTAAQSRADIVKLQQQLSSLSVEDLFESPFVREISAAHVTDKEATSRELSMAEIPRVILISDSDEDALDFLQAEEERESQSYAPPKGFLSDSSAEEEDFAASARQSYLQNSDDDDDDHDDDDEDDDGAIEAGGRARQSSAPDPDDFSSFTDFMSAMEKYESGQEYQ